MVQKGKLYKISSFVYVLLVLKLKECKKKDKITEELKGSYVESREERKTNLIHV